jgi:hypothetical protein
MIFRIGALLAIVVLAVYANLESASATEVGFFPTPPPGAKLFTATGVLTNYGIGMKSGHVWIQPPTGKPVEFYVSTTMTINGKSIHCVAPPQGGHTFPSDLCSDWPSGLSIGKTSVTVTYWITSRNGVAVNATNQIHY